jgi:RNA polymerase sigma-70 factor (ECF subfamily)
MLDDETLYRQVLQGNKGALIELIRRYHAPLYKFLCRFSGDAVLADDLAQETFTRLLTYQGSLPIRFKPWAYAIARNLARDHFKSAHYRYEHSTDFEDDTAGIPGDAGFAADDREAVIQALTKLSDDHREVLILRFYHDLKLEEIADVTHAPVGTVKSRLFHALKLMKGFLAITEGIYD